MLSTFASLGVFLLLCFPEMIYCFCPQGWEEHNDTEGVSCYYIDVNKKPFDAAVSKCIRLKSVMMSLHSKEEEDFLKTVTSDYPFWLGLNTDSKGDTWLDGTPYDYDNWRYRKCAHQCCKNEWSYVGWNAVACWEEARLICKKPFDSDSGSFLRPFFWMVPVLVYCGTRF